MMKLMMLCLKHGLTISIEYYKPLDGFRFIASKYYDGIQFSYANTIDKYEWEDTTILPLWIDCFCAELETKFSEELQ